MQTNHGGAVVVIFVCRLPVFQAAPAETMVTLGTGHTENREHHHHHSSSPPAGIMTIAATISRLID